MTDHYAVMGHPISHSKSPFIHGRFASQTGQQVAYRAIHVQPGHFPAAVEDFRADGGRGLNVTLPFKEEAWSLADERQPRAERAGAVNTLWFETDGRLVGDNTDGEGLVRDLRDNWSVALTGRRVLLLGAGGAARGVLGAVLAEGPDELVVANRTPGRADALVADWPEEAPLRGCGFDGVGEQAFDVIVNATSASLDGRVPSIPDTALAPGGCCYDMMYADRPTAFVEWGRARGAALSLDGLGMLVEQAAESFYLWRGVRPATAPVIEELRQGASASA